MLFTIWISALLIGLDQLTKYIMVTGLKPVGSVEIIPGILEFMYVEITGAAFSIFAGKQAILIGVTSLALLAVGYVLLFRKPKKKLEYWAVLLIFSGGIGNLIDRIANGYVVDFVNFLFVRFAVFNVADIYVTFGFIFLVISLIREELQNRNNKKVIAEGSEPEKEQENTNEEKKDSTEASLSEAPQEKADDHASR